jgi:hypothetical protein
MDFLEFIELGSQRKKKLNNRMIKKKYIDIFPYFNFVDIGWLREDLRPDHRLEMRLDDEVEL